MSPPQRLSAAPALLYWQCAVRISGLLETPQEGAARGSGEFRRRIASGLNEAADAAC